jgi:hypothetical protein
MNLTSDWQKGFQPEERKKLLAHAYHESGHAAAGYSCGFIVRGITLQPRSMTREEYDALVRPAYPFFAAYAPGEADIDYSSAFVAGQIKDLGRLKLWAMSMLAGELAQIKACPNSGASEGGKHDRDKVDQEAIKLIFEGTLDSFVDSVKAQTHHLLDNKVIWAAVRACADLLLKQGTVTGDELERLARWRPARDVAVRLAAK